MTNTIKKFTNIAGEAIGFGSKYDWFMRRDAFKNYVGCLDRSCPEWRILRQMCRLDEEWVVLNYSDPNGLQFQFVNMDC